MFGLIGVLEKKVKEVPVQRRAIFSLFNETIFRKQFIRQILIINPWSALLILLVFFYLLAFVIGKGRNIDLSTCK